MGGVLISPFNADDVKRVEKAARASKLSVSEWIRSTLNAAMEA
jgi:ribosome recycling factor